MFPIVLLLLVLVLVLGRCLGSEYEYEYRCAEYEYRKGSVLARPALREELRTSLVIVVSVDAVLDCEDPDPTLTSPSS